MASSPVLELERLLLLEYRRPAEAADTCGWWRSEPDTELRHTELDTDSWLPRSEAAPQPGPRMEEVRCGTGAGGPCAEATELEESVERRREKVERAGGGGGGGELARLEKEDIITGCCALAQPLSRLDSEVRE